MENDKWKIALVPRQNLVASGFLCFPFPIFHLPFSICHFPFFICHFSFVICHWSGVRLPWVAAVLRGNSQWICMRPGAEGILASMLADGMPVRAKDFSQSAVEGPRMFPSM